MPTLPSHRLLPKTAHRRCSLWFSDALCTKQFKVTSNWYYLVGKVGMAALCTPNTYGTVQYSTLMRKVPNLGKVISSR